MNHLKDLREKNGIHSTKIAEKVNISAKTYRRYESGNTLPNIFTAIRIADVLGVCDLREIWQEE